MFENVRSTTRTAESEVEIEGTQVNDDAEATTVTAAKPDDGGAVDETADIEKPKAATPTTLRLRKAAVVVVGLALVAVAVVFGMKWQSTQGDLDEIRAERARVAAATTVAREYTARSLTYDYHDVDAFFAGVNQGATPSLRGEYEKARGDLQSLMETAQVVASGDIVATSVLSSSPNRYEFAVTAIQKTKNLQQPEDAQVPNVLKLIVVRSGNSWLVDKYSSM